MTPTEVAASAIRILRQTSRAVHAPTSEQSTALEELHDLGRRWARLDRDTRTATANAQRVGLSHNAIAQALGAQRWPPRIRGHRKPTWGDPQPHHESLRQVR